MGGRSASHLPFRQRSTSHRGGALVARGRRSGQLLVAVAAVTLFAAFLLSSTGPSSRASTTFSFTRLQGADRYDTAKAIAEQTFTTSRNVVPDSGNDPH